MKVIDVLLPAGTVDGLISHEESTGGGGSVGGGGGGGVGVAGGASVAGICVLVGVRVGLRVRVGVILGGIDVGVRLATSVNVADGD
jgi:hypothetical protein